MKKTLSKDIFKIKYTESIIIAFHRNIEEIVEKQQLFGVFRITIIPMVLIFSFN